MARVVTVEELENSEKLYKLTIDVGGGEIKQVTQCPQHSANLVPGNACRSRHRLVGNKAVTV